MRLHRHKWWHRWDHRNLGNEGNRTGERWQTDVWNECKRCGEKRYTKRRVELLNISTSFTITGGEPPQ